MRVSTQTLEKKILPPLLPGFKLTTFQSEVGHFTNKLSQPPQLEQLTLPVENTVLVLLTPATHKQMGFDCHSS